MFTRPANKKSQLVRSAKESSRYVGRESRRAFTGTGTAGVRSRSGLAGLDRVRRWRERASTGTYRERNQVVKDIRRDEHVYIGSHNRICRTRIRPRHRFILSYNWGPWCSFSYFRPYYHRRYVFVSLGGYWPLDYRYRRYYWYGYHPYRWYGYYPIAREVGGNTYNYYTYYYNGDTVAADPSQAAYPIAPVDHTTFEDIREKLAQQAEEPYEVTLADRYFEEAVGAFELDNYDRAAERFAQAIELAPDDMVLPFAYSQALFAAEEYTEAAEVLRAALAKVSPEDEGIFYPRGLYSDDDTLFEQMDRLAKKAELYSFDGDLQLLLGYNLLGIGEIDEAVEPLRLATLDLKNAPAATVLLNLLEKIRSKDAEEAE